MNSPTPMPKCNTCTHYYITHDIHFRYGCRALGFKSQQQPIKSVLDASGKSCLYFVPRQKS
jgi:ribosomal protein L32